MKTALEIVHDGLAASETRMMLIGAYALQAYDVVRQTMDLDCLVVNEDECVLAGVLRDAGYVEKQRTEAFVRYSHPAIWFMDVDVMIVDRGTFDTMYAQSCDRDVQSRSVRVPCLPHRLMLVSCLSVLSGSGLIFVAEMDRWTVGVEDRCRWMLLA
jgi:hypothetical protein